VVPFPQLPILPTPQQISPTGQFNMADYAFPYGVDFSQAPAVTGAYTVPPYFISPAGHPLGMAYPIPAEARLQ